MINPLVSITEVQIPLDLLVAISDSTRPTQMRQLRLKFLRKILDGGICAFPVHFDGNEAAKVSQEVIPGDNRD